VKIGWALWKQPVVFSSVFFLVHAWQHQVPGLYIRYECKMHTNRGKTPKTGFFVKLQQ